MKKFTLPRIAALFLALTIIMTGSSCKKKNTEKSPGGYFMKFKMDGTDITWSQGFAQFSNSSLTRYTASGFESDASTSKTLTVYIANDGPIDLGADYTYPAVNVRITYTDEHSTSFNNNDLTATMKITEETSVYLKGTFSGTVKDDNGNTKVITDGSFTLGKPA
jgi:hypothetical protein